MTVLIVDTAQPLLDGLISAFTSAGFNTEVETDASATVERCRSLRPAVVVLDASNGNVSVLELGRTLREEGVTAAAAIMVLTDDDPDSVDRAYESGAADTITGPPASWRMLGRRAAHLVRIVRERNEMRSSTARLDRAIRMAGVGWWEWDVDGNRFHCSEGLRRMLGGDNGPRSFAGFMRAVHVQDRNKILALAEAGAGVGANKSLAYRLTAADGSIRRVRQRTEITRDKAGKPVRVSGTLHEVDDAGRDTSDGAHLVLADFDPVTRLPNRRRLMERMRIAFDLAEGYGRIAGILFLDLDGFKRINDSLGHAAGDRVLCEAGRRLTRVIRKTDLAARDVEPAAGELVARFGGDEFVLLLPELRRAEDAFTVARRVVTELARPYEVGNREVFTTVSVGIATYPEDGTEPELLLKHADTAMYDVKESGKNGIRMFTASMNQRAEQRLEIESGLRGAIRRDELTLLYQPKITVRSGAVLGVEALLRWKKSGGRLVSPADFISVVEDSSLILPLGRWVFERVCRQIKEWDEAGLPAIRVAMNVSSRQFDEPRYAEYIARTLAGHGIPPSRLELELTEGALVRNPEQIGDSLAELKSMGLRLALDDFGTGYASLSLLRRFPLDSVKIDRSFVQGIPGDADSAAVTSAILMMAQALGLEVVAEGVETEEQREFLAMLGCDEIQGFLFSRPISAGKLSEMLERESRGQAVGELRSRTPA
jgi:diguanylate cyclase (GGDEF)-like protein